MGEVGLHKWLGFGHKQGWLGRSIIEQLLSYEENYEPLLNNFFGNGAKLSQIPKLDGIKRDALPDAVALGNGLNPPGGKAAKETFAQNIARWFEAQHTRMVFEEDLYMANPFLMPSAKTRASDNTAIFSLSYRNAVILDRFLEKSAPLLQWGTGHNHTLQRVLEIGAGWGSFPALAQKLLGGGGRRGSDERSGKETVQYVILDLPHSCLIQANFLRTLGQFSKFIMYDPSMGSLDEVVHCGDYEFLWILPQHLPSLTSTAFDLIFNFDSIVEMPPEVVTNYVRQFATISRGGFYSVNRDYNSWKILQTEIRKLKWHVAHEERLPDLCAKTPGVARNYSCDKTQWEVALHSNYVEQLWTPEATANTAGVDNGSMQPPLAPAGAIVNLSSFDGGCKQAPGLPARVAVCLWGVNRALEMTIRSLDQKIFAPFAAAAIKVGSDR
jgi:hypothetical protein